MGMRNPHQYPWALAAMVTYFTVNYLAVALSGDFFFSYLSSSIVASEVSLSFSVTPLYRAAVYLYIAQLLLSFPLILFVVFVSYEAALMPRQGLRSRRMLRAFLILAMGGIAIVVPHFGDFLAVAGAIANSLGIYILPHAALMVAARQGMKISRWRQ